MPDLGVMVFVSVETTYSERNARIFSKDFPSVGRPLASAASSFSKRLGPPPVDNRSTLSGFTISQLYHEPNVETISKYKQRLHFSSPDYLLSNCRLSVAHLASEAGQLYT